MSGERGFTLVEVLVAATMLVVSVLATLTLLDNATKTTAVGKQRDVANAVAQEMIERATGGRYSTTRNDLTDVDTAAARPGPADRLRASMDPDGDQASTAVTPATATIGTVPVNVAQSWTLQRKSTTFTVSYRACTSSDVYQQVQIAGPFDCSRASSDPTALNQATSGGCGLGAASTTGSGASLTVHLQVLGISSLNSCLSLPGTLPAALCTLLGSSDILAGVQGTLLGSGGQLSSMLGGLAGGSVSVCPATQVEQSLSGPSNGIASSTLLAVTVGWTDQAGKPRTLSQSALVRRGDV